MRRRLVPKRSGEEEQEDEDVTMPAEEEEEDDDEDGSEGEEEEDEEEEGSEEEPQLLKPDGTVTSASKGSDKTALRRALKKRSDAADAKEQSKGIRWGPFLFLIFMMGPAVFGAVDFLMTKFKLYGPPDPKMCLTRYYQRVHPARLQEISIDDVLAKYKGREGQLYRNLEKKYRVPCECE